MFKINGLEHITTMGRQTPIIQNMESVEDAGLTEESKKDAFRMDSLMASVVRLRQTVATLKAIGKMDGDMEQEKKFLTMAKF